MRKTKKFSPGQPSLFGLSARQCLDGELPESTPNCKQCAYLSDVKAMDI